MTARDDRSWLPITADSPPEGVLVDTRIDDEKGVRNEQRLLRYKRLWFFADSPMYVDYTPTHWRPIGDQ